MQWTIDLEFRKAFDTALQRASIWKGGDRGFEKSWQTKLKRIQRHSGKKQAEGVDENWSCWKHYSWKVEIVFYSCDLGNVTFKIVMFADDTQFLQQHKQRRKSKSLHNTWIRPVYSIIHGHVLHSKRLRAATWSNSTALESNHREYM